MPKTTLERLTPRQIQTIKDLWKYESAKEAARAAKVSKRTVDFHLAAIYDILGVHNQIAMFKAAIKLGIVQPELA